MNDRALSRPAPARSVRRAVRVLIAVMLLSAALPFPADAAASCGKERWPVKTGTDGDIGQVDLSRVTTTSIGQMRGLTAPGVRPQDRRVLPTETTVFAITASITHYKREPDSDYHLVITDSNGLTMVAEIPLPACVKGPSQLTAGIASARSTFDANLHASTQFQELIPPLPVRLVGVGFFDTPNHGKGAPANGIELHPVLSIDFHPGAVPITPSRTPVPASPAPATPGGIPAPAGPSTDAMPADSSFEEGPGGPWAASDGVITNSTKRASHSGTFYAWLGGYGKVNTDTLHQSLSLSPTATSITLSFWLSVSSREVSKADDYDILTVELRSATGARLAGLAEYSNLDARGTYVRRTFDLTAYRGQTVDLWFTAVEDKSLPTSFLLDDFLLIQQ